MNALVACLALAISVGLATGRAQHLARNRRLSPTGRVMSAVDDRVLFGGVLAGGAVGGLCGAVVSFGPAPLAWSWLKLLPGVPSTADQGPVTASIVVLVAMLVLPSIVILALPMPMLAITAIIARVRQQTPDRTPRAVAVALTGLGLLVAGMPVIAALTYGPAIALVGTHVRRRPVVQRVPAGHPDNLGTEPPPLVVVWTGERQARAYSDDWYALGSTAQHQAVRVAAVHVVLAASALTSLLLVAILTA